MILFYSLKYYRVAQALGNIMELILFTMTITCSVVLAFSLFVIDFCGVFSYDALNATLNSILILAVMFTYCYLSEGMTSDLVGIGNIFYNSQWYRLRVKEQKLMALPIQRAQRAYRLKGLHLYDCSLAVFSSVGMVFL